MRARIRFIAPLVLALAVTTACGESGSSGTGGGEETDAAASGAACAPVEGEQLVVLEDDQGLQNADNIIPAVHAATAEAQPALLPALNAVSAALTTEELIGLNAAVDLERQSAEDVAAAWVEENGVTEGLEQGSGPIVVGAADFSENVILANIYAGVLNAAGFTATVTEAGSRNLYLEALKAGQQIQVVPEYLATVTEFIEADDANPVASGDVDETLAALEPLATAAGLAFGEPSEAADQNAFAVTQAFADELGVATLSELAEACGDGSLVLGGPPECPTRPFCQLGLEEAYGMEFESFRELDAGGPLTKAAIQQGEVSIGLVFSSDAALAQN
ncbi:glycine/betaine ABC transporter substrate-binding protein [Blastococcus sp. CT_GayMR19]|uniref:glycine betaine ABC transporter substrate-binding protein n=1 Tax=Blastococcus sp. CT_GayMR19 TaxID=2559608 RepID=UPI0010732E1F|nr:glycine betaine ABC transporter substrate-binding protein [Blastococcus sp. CT_GayMR19]TFV73373.1 glycine/betaine ABC transporter substrate-binding protein [Blastococcus sp. CT_GayMR19]